MLTNEAAWLERELARLPDSELDPMLCIGSGTAHSREVLQPWINEHVYAPLAMRGIRTIHHEYVDGPGVDISGDLASPELAEQLRALGARAVLCCNVLEHLADRRSAVALLDSLVPAGGHLILSVPHRFPYHPDPIDTMYRPSVSELAGEFGGLEVEAGAEVECGTLLAYLRRSGSLRTSVSNGVKTALGRKGGDVDANPADRPGSGALPYLFRQTAVTCAILRRPAA